ncbi:squalene--hopene cyclase [Dactylosporangium sp. NPDC051485]|uniref:squalene--hopene cyclase n=1 Tax=Dactylosporangium sp. NPDC051485 TaxID=3154846 RepID=UPI00344ADC01
MVDLDAAIGYVVAHGDAVDRARLAWLRTGQTPPPDILDKAEVGQASTGGWPAYWGAHVASVDATCFRLGELDDLGAIDRPAARKALHWLGESQRPDGMWEEDESLAGVAPPWAQPGDDEARLFLTTSAAFWLIVGGPTPGDEDEHAARIARAAEAFRASLRPDGSWPSFLVTGWLGCAVLYHLGWFYESAQIQVALADRVPNMTGADTAWLFASLRRVGMSTDDWLLSAARRRLWETQRSDGGWNSDDGDQFNVHTTLTAIRALR